MEVESKIKNISELLKFESEEIFTTNYDLILYWAVAHKLKEFCDGFGYEDSVLCFRNNYPNQKKVYFLHGALHLYKENGRVRKVSQNSINLLGTIEKRMKEGILPLFVSEGTSELKLEAIRSNLYLNHCYESLKSITGCLTIFGHGLSKETDQHIINAIKDNANISKIFYSVYTTGISPDIIRSEIYRVKSLFPKHDGKIIFFDYKSLMKYIETKDFDF